jgi:hypothetical protein
VIDEKDATRGIAGRDLVGHEGEVKHPIKVTMDMSGRHQIL